MPIPTLLQEFQKVMKDRNIKIPAVSKKIDIPADRIYKWYQEGLTPKVEDSIKIRAWIDGTTSSNISKVEEADGNYIIKVDMAMKIISTQADIIKSQQETIDFLTRGGAVKKTG